MVLIYVIVIFFALYSCIRLVLHCRGAKWKNFFVTMYLPIMNFYVNCATYKRDASQRTSAAISRTCSGTHAHLREISQLPLEVPQCQAQCDVKEQNTYDSLTTQWREFSQALVHSQELRSPSPAARRN